MQIKDYKKIDFYFYNPNAVPLGRGAFATVYKGYNEITRSEIAIKVIPVEKIINNEENYNLLTREIEVLKQIKGDNIVNLLDLKRTTNNIYVFTDFCNGGNLEQYLKKKISISEEETLTMLKQITKAFINLDNIAVKNHKGNRVTIMHRDIKPSNILFHDNIVKIADFGFAKFVDENVKNMKLHHTLLGTPYYSSPQILGDQAYSIKCDIWSTGIIIYKCLTGQLPWTSSTIPGLLSNIKKLPLECPKWISLETKDLLEKMLQVKEEDRIDWKGIWDHPALKNAKEIKKEPIINLGDFIIQPQIPGTIMIIDHPDYQQKPGPVLNIHEQYNIKNTPNVIIPKQF